LPIFLKNFKRFLARQSFDVMIVADCFRFESLPWGISGIGEIFEDFYVVCLHLHSLQMRLIHVFLAQHARLKSKVHSFDSDWLGRVCFRLKSSGFIVKVSLRYGKFMFRDSWRVKWMNSSGPKLRYAITGGRWYSPSVREKLSKLQSGYFSLFIGHRPSLISLMEVML
jgi:hypothetical protein